MKHLEAQFRGGLAWQADWPVDAPPLHPASLPARLFVPLVDQDSAELLAPGTHVVRGELLTRASAETGPAALAPVSGRVLGRCEVMLLNGRRTPAIELEADKSDFAAGPAPAHDLVDLPKSLESVGHDDLPEWVDVLRRAGVWADRRGSPDLLAQLMQALKRPVDTVLCNLLDSDPPLRPSAIVGHRSTTALLAGAELLARLTAARRTMLIVEADAPSRWWTALERSARKSGFVVYGMPHRYPQGDPTLLLYTALERKLRPGRLPTDQGAVLVDAAALVAIGRCCARQQAMLQVPIAIADHVSRRLCYLIAPVGVPLRHLLGQVGIDADDVTLLAGDRLRQHAISPDAVTSGGELAVHVMARKPDPIPDACIQCSWCAEHCPTRVQPAGVLEAAQTEDMDLAERHGLDGCIECGVCSQVCPARLPLLQVIQNLRRQSSAGSSTAPSPAPATATKGSE